MVVTYSIRNHGPVSYGMYYLIEGAEQIDLHVAHHPLEAVGAARESVAGSPDVLSQVWAHHHQGVAFLAIPAYSVISTTAMCAEETVDKI